MAIPPTTTRRIARLALVASVALMVELVASRANAFLPQDRWLATASGPTGERGQPITLTWSLVPDGTEVRNRQSSRLISVLDESFGVVDQSGDLAQRPWFDLVESAFARWGELGGVSFLYEPTDDGALHGQTPGELGVRGDVRLAGTLDDGVRGTLAFSQFPDGGDIGLDTSDLSWMLTPPTDDYRMFRNVLMHEIGHVLGLDHVRSSDADMLMEPELNLQFDGPQLDDIRGLHHLYGDRLEKDEIDSAALWVDSHVAPVAMDLGMLGAGRVLQLGGDAGTQSLIAYGSTDFLSISNRSDIDRFLFEIDEPVLLDVDLIPRGGIFHQSAIGDAERGTNATASSNLTLTIVSDAGVMVERDMYLAGIIESVSDLPLTEPGRFFIQVTGTREIVQLYELQIATEALRVPEPSTHVLLVLSAVPIFRSWHRSCNSFLQLPQHN